MYFLFLRPLHALRILEDHSRNEQMCVYMQKVYIPAVADHDLNPMTGIDMISILLVRFHLLSAGQALGKCSDMCSI